MLERIRAALPKVKVPSSYDRVYKDECMFCFAGPESDEGIFVNLNSWVGVGSRFLALEHERSGNVLYYREKHHRIPLEENGMDAQDSAPTKMAIGGEDGFQVDKKNYTVEKEFALVVMPERTVVPLPNDELPELVLQAIAGVQVRRSCWRHLLAAMQSQTNGQHPPCARAHHLIVRARRATTARAGRTRRPVGRRTEGRASMQKACPSCPRNASCPATPPTGSATSQAPKTTFGSTSRTAPSALAGASGTAPAATARPSPLRASQHRLHFAGH